MLDLIVVGAGLAGLMAAHEAATAGMKVKVISKGLGSHHWTAGSVDLLGYNPDDGSPVKRPLEAIAQLVREHPRHPYALLDEGGVKQAIDRFASLTEEIGLRYVGAADGAENLWLPSPAGAERPTFLASEAQIAGDLSRPEPMLIVGIRGLRDFYPELIAENLVKGGRRARAEYIPASLITGRTDSNLVHLALALDSPSIQNALALELKKLVRSGERVGLPAVLGMEGHTSAMQILRSQIGAPVFEIPTLPPSVPGMRLDAALRRHLGGHGVRVEVNMDVINLSTSGDRVTRLETQSSGRPLVHQADRFLLATGGILGGGINSDHTGRVWETVLNLPLETPASRSEWFHGRFLDPAGHPIFRAGVPVNRRFQPVDKSGATVFANVWAAGSILANTDPILERSLEGIAIATGFAAAHCATG